MRRWQVRLIRIANQPVTFESNRIGIVRWLLQTCYPYKQMLQCVTHSELAMWCGRHSLCWLSSVWRNLCCHIVLTSSTKPHSTRTSSASLSDVTCDFMAVSRSSNSSHVSCTIPRPVSSPLCADIQCAKTLLNSQQLFVHVFCEHGFWVLQLGCSRAMLRAAQKCYHAYNVRLFVKLEFHSK